MEDKNHWTKEREGTEIRVMERSPNRCWNPLSATFLTATANQNMTVKQDLTLVK